MILNILAVDTEWSGSHLYRFKIFHSLSNMKPPYTKIYMLLHLAKFFHINLTGYTNCQSVHGIIYLDVVY